MSSVVETADAMPRSLAKTLDQSEQLKDKVKDCAENLSSVNAVLKEEMAGRFPFDRMKGALSQSKEIEGKVSECVEDISLVNIALTKEIADREALENELSQSKIEEEKARYLAFHDNLTGLSNRALFDDRLKTALARAQRHERGFALLFIDVDGFKSINDNHGHAIGDDVLRTVAKRLEACTRTEDTVSRYGGDEFLCLLSEVDDENHAAKIVRDISRSISTICNFGEVQLILKASVGVAMYPRDGGTPAALIDHADAAMYAAKQDNRINPKATGYRFFAEIENRK